MKENTNTKEEKRRGEINSSIKPYHYTKKVKSCPQK